MTPNRVKLGRAVSFIKYLASVSLFNISTENFNLK